MYMDIKESTYGTKPKRKKLDTALDRPMTTKQRSVAVNLLDKPTATAALQQSGTADNYMHMVAKNVPVMGPLVHKILSKQEAITKIEAFCMDILERDIETPLKASDKVAAARLLADLKGVASNKQEVTLRIQETPLKEIPSEELEAELARLEEMKSNAIDAVVV